MIIVELGKLNLPANAHTHAIKSIVGDRQGTDKLEKARRVLTIANAGNVFSRPSSYRNELSRERVQS